MVKASCGHFCIACLRPLTRRWLKTLKINWLWFFFLPLAIRLGSSANQYLFNNASSEQLPQLSFGI
nr:hypothetical protein [Vibrio navarrensis]